MIWLQREIATHIYNNREVVKRFNDVASFGGFYCILYYIFESFVF